jgi:hypothetical protein
MTTPIDTPPVPAHITNIAELAGAVGGRIRRRKHIRAVYRTFVLTAASPVVPVAAQDLSRCGGWAIAYGNSVVLCETQSQAQDPANAIVGTATGFTLAPANPQGTLLYVPLAGTAQSDRWPIDSNEPIWASASYLTGGQTAMLVVTLYNETTGFSQ